MSDAKTIQHVPPPEWRRKLQAQARTMVSEKGLLPPQTLPRLRTLAAQLRAEAGLSGAGYDDYAMVMLNNALWEPQFRRIPRSQRLLLLPHCLRSHEHCQASRDDLGLICAGCGSCMIPKLMEQAEALKMPVLVAESSERVAEWVEQGEIQAVVGVSCLEAMEKSFPAMLRYAVPGIGVPLLKDGCVDTQFDPEFLREELALAEDPTAVIPAHPQISGIIQSLFTVSEARKFLQTAAAGLPKFPHEIEDALCGNGKHYRPKITYGVYAALTLAAAFPECLKPVALAVECFHKASLIHDDIEDGDDTRYGQPAMHRRLGLAAALNAGDFLLGEGYRLLGHEAIPEHCRGALYQQAARAHGELAMGQAREFELGEMTLAQCLETQRLKTAPAFRMALEAGAILAGKFADCEALFKPFAELFGVSYQLHDDLEDTMENRASAVDCLMREKQLPRAAARQEIIRLYQTYREQVYQLLEEVREVPLKVFLYRLAGKVLTDA